MNAQRTIRFAVCVGMACVEFAMLPGRAVAQSQGMSGMDMGQISIPKGADFTAADVRFMQGIYQLTRDQGLSSNRLSAIDKALTTAESQHGAARGASLTALAKSVDADVAGSSDKKRVTAMARAIRDLAAASK